MVQIKDIKGYEGLYAITEDGRVFSYKRNKFMNGSIDTSGYRQFDLRGRAMLAHRLVALTFMPNLDCLPEINHIDGNKLNNYIHNLEWCTRKHNMSEAKRLKLFNPNKGINNHMSKKVVCIETGEVFDCAVSASKSIGAKVNNYVAVAIKRSSKAYGKTFKYMEF